MNVLSLFDGMSCGQQALQRQGIKVDKYYASEIDKHAIQITQKNYPGTIQLGSVVNVDVHNLDKIDLLIGGSPCQSFSFAGKRKGMRTKEFPNFSAPTVQEWEEYLLDENSVYFEYSDYCDVLFERYEWKCASLTKETIEILSLDQYLELKEQNFEFEGQSYLFWEYMRILTDLRKLNPDVKFLLENVMMGEKWEKVLSRAIGVNPIEINSALVSAQNRRRLYWTNIGMKPAGLFGDLESVIVQPKDRGILLKDILESEVDEKYFLSEKTVATITKHGNSIISDNENPLRSCTIHANYFKMGGRDQQYIVHNTMPRSSTTGKGGTGHLSRNDGKTYCLDTGNTNAVEIKTLSNTHNKRIFTNNRHKNEKQEKARSYQTLQVLQNIIGKEKDGQWQMAVYARFYENEVLFNEMFGKFLQGAYSTAKNNKIRKKPGSKNDTEVSMYDMQYKAGIGCASHRQEPSKQFIREFAKSVSRMPQQHTQNDKAMQSLWAEAKRTWVLRKALSEIQEIWKSTNCENQSIHGTQRIRRLTPLEAERLQTVKDGYTEGVSDTQRYRMLGNGWTIEVIAHIFSYL